MLKHLLLPALVLLASCTSPESETEDAGIKLLVEAHMAVEGRLKDPNSADFDDTGAAILPDHGLVCNGKVNAKNSFGGYTGFELYWYSRTSGAVTQNDPYEAVAKITDECMAALR